MRAQLESITKALHRHESRMPRHLRPRATRSTYVPLRDEAVLRGVARLA
ncbi:MAG: hypothetical protein QM602_01255 [Microbacterium sp.]